MPLSLNEALANAHIALTQDSNDAENVALLDLIAAVEAAPEPSKVPEPFGSPQDAGLVASYLDDMPEAWNQFVADNTDWDDAEVEQMAEAIPKALHTYAETDG